MAAGRRLGGARDAAQRSRTTAPAPSNRTAQRASRLSPTDCSAPCVRARYLRGGPLTPFAVDAAGTPRLGYGCGTSTLTPHAPKRQTLSGGYVLRYRRVPADATPLATCCCGCCCDKPAWGAITATSAIMMETMGSAVTYLPTSYLGMNGLEGLQALIILFVALPRYVSRPRTRGKHALFVGFTAAAEEARARRDVLVTGVRIIQSVQPAIAARPLVISPSRHRFAPPSAPRD